MTELRQRLTGLAGICLMLGACASDGSKQQSQAAEANPQPVSLYPATEPYPATFERLDQARQQAIEEDKLLLLVMGADWCHDSRGFVHKLEDPAMATLVEERYQVLLVNVGYLEYIRGVVDRYDVPVIYGTPTVLVIEPVTNTLLNGNSLPYWRNADSISMADTMTYFEGYRPGQRLPDAPAAGPALAAALQAIDNFEDQQAQRIYLAYAELGDIMQGMNPNKPSAEFLEKWKNLGQMRSQITEDLSNLRSEARAQAAAGIDPIKLQYPHYALFIDDTAATGGD